MSDEPTLADRLAIAAGELADYPDLSANVAQADRIVEDLNEAAVALRQLGSGEEVEPMSDRTIEDVLATDRLVGRYEVEGDIVRAIHNATADGPVFSEDGSIVAHRTDPELAERLRTIARTDPNVAAGWENRALRRAARLIGGES